MYWSEQSFTVIGPEDPAHCENCIKIEKHYYKLRQYKLVKLYGNHENVLLKLKANIHTYMYTLRWLDRWSFTNINFQVFMLQKVVLIINCMVHIKLFNFPITKMMLKAMQAHSIM